MIWNYVRSLWFLNQDNVWHWGNTLLAQQITEYQYNAVPVEHLSENDNLIQGMNFGQIPYHVLQRSRHFSIKA